jgi:hypothetical protein
VESVAEHSGVFNSNSMTPHRSIDCGHRWLRISANSQDSRQVEREWKLRTIRLPKKGALAPVWLAHVPLSKLSIKIEDLQCHCLISRISHSLDLGFGFEEFYFTLFVLFFCFFGSVEMKWSWRHHILDEKRECRGWAAATSLKIQPQRLIGVFYSLRLSRASSEISALRNLN